MHEPNYDALAGATRRDAEYLDDPTLGVIAPGAGADFLLARDNPLDDRSMLRSPAAIPAARS